MVRAIEGALTMRDEMTEQSLITKNRIMEVARILFADQGFDGTSVREIAKAAEVNVASVNYHFMSKENLYTEILRQGYIQCSTEMRAFYDENQPDLEETLVFLFRYFMDRSHDLVSQFKILMSTQHSHQVTSAGTEDASYGPPGGKVIAEALQKAVGPTISEKDMYWGLRTLFNHVVHYSLLYNCCLKNQSHPYSSIADIEDSIRRLAKVVVSDLKRS